MVLGACSGTGADSSATTGGNGESTVLSPLSTTSTVRESTTTSEAATTATAPMGGVADWVRVPHTEVFGNESGFAMMMGVAAGGPGFVAVGVCCGDSGDPETGGPDWTARLRGVFGHQKMVSPGIGCRMSMPRSGARSVNQCSTWR